MRIDAELTEDHRAMRHDVAAVPVDRDVLRVAGADAVTFLQGQLSADVAALAPGGSTWSLLLEPQGKVDAWVRVWRRDADGGGAEVLIDVDGGYGEEVAARLSRFLLRVDVEVAPLAWTALALRGPRSSSVDVSGTGAELVGAVDWSGVPGIDLLGPDVRPPGGVRVATPAALESLRVECGWPAMGRELDPTVIPAEAGQWLVDASVSFTKGCYTGQELVARIDSRGGNTPRRLRGVVVDVAGGGDRRLPPEGAAVVVDGEERGRLTSVAASPALGAVALAYVHRSVEPPASAVVRWDGGEASGRVVDLPLVPADAGGLGAG